jgi:hypothetical protein
MEREEASFSVIRCLEDKDIKGECKEVRIPMIRDSMKDFEGSATREG